MNSLKCRLNIHLIIVMFFILSGCTSFTAEDPDTQQTGSTSIASIDYDLATKVAETRDGLQTGTPQVETQTPVFGLPSPIELPTVPKEMRRDYILDLLSTNGNCDLPCFWTIEPGISTLEDAERLMKHSDTSYLLRTQGEENHLFAGYDNPEFNIPLGLDFIEKGGIIENIGVSMAMKRGYNTSPYELPTVLSTLGKPTRVYIDLIYNGQGTIGGYQLFIFYDEMDVFLSYSGENLQISSTINICPLSEGEDGINSAGILLGKLNSDYGIHMIIPMMVKAKELDKISDLSIETFYQLFKITIQRPVSNRIWKAGERCSFHRRC